MEKGEIYLARDREKHYHPIVFLEQIDIVRFKACIISTKSTNGNIPMLHGHFYMNHENGAPYKIQFRNSFLVPNHTFIKMEFWLASSKVQGKLTELGLSFIAPYVRVDPVLCLTTIQSYLSR